MVQKILVSVAAISSTLLVACSGASFDLPQTSNNFSQSVAYNNKVDIVWIMDNSSSMQQHQQRLSSQIPELVTKLNSLKMDYHMAVVTTSMGGTNPNGGQFIGTPKYLTSATGDLTNQLASRLVVGQDGSDNERGLYSMETALSSGYLANDGKGFYRDDALLVVVALSDEDDKSKSSSSAAITYYTNFLDGIKKPWPDGSRAWTFNFIGVIANSTACTTFDNYSEPGLAFMGLADASGGTKNSICTTDLSSAVSNIRSRVMQILTDFKLTSVPVVSSIQVSINGVSIPENTTNGWEYISATNVIRFYGSAVPAADASIKVDFKPAEAN